MGNIIDIDKASWESEVLQSDMPVLVDFWAPWCGPCTQLGPIVEMLAEENAEKIRVYKVNVDENKDIAVELGIRGIPTLVFFKAGNEIKRLVGAQGKEHLQQVINEVI